MDGDPLFALNISAHQEQTRRVVRAMMALTGLSASGLARAAGLTPSTLNRFMHKPVRHTLSQRTMLALMTETFRKLKERPQQALDTEALAVLAPAIATYEEGIVEAVPDVRLIVAEVKGLTSDAVHRPFPDTSLSTLPVLLAATHRVNAESGAFELAPLKTQRPPFLEGDDRAFALLMPDASMAPRFDAGDMLYVSPARALEGDRIDVVIERAAGGFVVGTLMAVASDGARIATLNPRTRVFFRRDKIRGVYRVVGVQRLGG